jgi:choline kinase
MQAIILAAGMGKRLGELTKGHTKCMVKVNGETLISRLLKQLDQCKLHKIILVIGYKGNELKEYISTLQIHTPIEYVENDVYDKTNNIFSLFLAKDALLTDDTLLFESDIILEDSIIDLLIQTPEKDIAIVDKYEPWMDGTVVTIDEDNRIDVSINCDDEYIDFSIYYFKTRYNKNIIFINNIVVD